MRRYLKMLATLSIGLLGAVRAAAVPVAGRECFRLDRLPRAAAELDARPTPESLTGQGKCEIGVGMSCLDGTQGSACTPESCSASSDGGRNSLNVVW